MIWYLTHDMISDTHDMLSYSWYDICHHNGYHVMMCFVILSCHVHIFCILYNITNLFVNSDKHTSWFTWDKVLSAFSICSQTKHIKSCWPCAFVKSAWLDHHELFCMNCTVWIDLYGLITMNCSVWITHSYTVFFSPSDRQPVASYVSCWAGTGTSWSGKWSDT